MFLYFIAFLQIVWERNTMSQEGKQIIKILSFYLDIFHDQFSLSLSLFKVKLQCGTIAQ